ncbi:hypothetical protein JY651_33030 [Pyxidicoccus parkwayensis]|uniref:Lipoprotein n=1 Tax=Pyxidicoccus parkwayensis TaxID=2813578 RepID=A0ABX7NRE0_9BACT|nr:hypothetical protein [Pyxidicoccus parkwaysis]QSQ20077.1 hypothetical protein JY651_33030 [Pyxidicoccus parkwaysis]
MKTTRGALAVLAGLGLWLAGGTAGAVDRCARACEDDEAVCADICKQHAGKGVAKCQSLCAGGKKTCLKQCEEEAKAPPPKAPQSGGPATQGSGSAK